MARNTAKARFLSPKRHLFAPIAAAALMSTSAFAGEWEIGGDLYTGLTATDNVTLEPSGGINEEEFIWELSPTITAVRDGKQVDVQFNYRLQGLLYAREDRRNEVYNYLQTRLQADLIPDLFHFDADASISQTVIDPLLGSANSSISTNGNTAETLTVNVSPYILRRFGPSTVLTAGASAGLIEYDAVELNDNKQRSYFASLANDGGGGPFNWSFGYNANLVDYDIGREIELARITGEIGMRLGPRTEFVVSGGEDINDFGSLPGSRVAEGTFWNAGFRGGLGDNFQFDVRVGEQFFGDSYGVELTRTSRALVTTLAYTEEATTIGTQQLDFSNALSLLSLSGDLPSNFDINGFELPPRDPELYIRRRFDLSTTLNSGKSMWRAIIFYEDRTFIRTVLDGARENVQGARLEWNWDYDSSITVNSSATYQQLDSRDTVSKPADLRINVQVQRQILNSSYLQLRVWRNGRTAPQEADEYVEHALQIGFGQRF